MTRPMKQGLDYFPHDTDASGDEKVEALRSLHGNDGYAFYFIMLERIYRSPNCAVLITDKSRQVFADKVRVSVEKFNAMMVDALEVGCFDRDLFKRKQVLTSDGIDRRFRVVTNKREQMRQRREGEVKPTGDQEMSEEFLNVFRLWNKLCVIVHQKPTGKMAKAYEKAKKNWTPEQIFQSIRNYAYIVNNPDKFWFKYRWTLEEFLSRSNAIEKFVNDVCLTNMAHKGQENGRQVIGSERVDAIADAARRLSSSN